MVHLPPLPGSPKALPGTLIQPIVDRAVREAKLLVSAGFQAIIVENFGDVPFVADTVPPETVAGMAVVVREVARNVGVPVGVNVLRNDALAALAVAAVAGGAFVRVNVLSGTYATDQGLITGRPRELFACRGRLAPHLAIAADVHVKHAVPVSQPDLILAAEETAYRAGADILIVSGAATGRPTDLDAVRRVKSAVPDRPVWIGSGVTTKSIADCLAAADAVIVGTCLKKGGAAAAPLDPAKVRAFARAAAISG